MLAISGSDENRGEDERARRDENQNFEKSPEGSPLAGRSRLLGSSRDVSLITRWCFWNLEIILSSLLNRSTRDSDRGHPWHMAWRRGEILEGPRTGKNAAVGPAARRPVKIKII